MITGHYLENQFLTELALHLPARQTGTRKFCNLRQSILERCWVLISGLYVISSTIPGKKNPAFFMFQIGTLSFISLNERKEKIIWMNTFSRWTYLQKKWSVLDQLQLYPYSLIDLIQFFGRQLVWEGLYIILCQLTDSCWKLKINFSYYKLIILMFVIHKRHWNRILW